VSEFAYGGVDASDPLGGVGYDVHIPLSTYDKLPSPGAEAKILTHLVVRESTGYPPGTMENVTGSVPRAVSAIKRRKAAD